ncbi:MAG: hypothetical protein KAH16_05570 [Candidatus Izimaplasma sp.]|nr:hypothetical protein [Candidatus Izimaplasma bacterium]
MTKLEILNKLHFDKAHSSLNPYFFGNEYEEKGVLVLMKLEKGSDLDYLDIDNICFQCPVIEGHPELIMMILFLFDKNNKIYDYSIASSKFKINRSDILKYEEMIGIIID